MRFFLYRRKVNFIFLTCDTYIIGEEEEEEEETLNRIIFSLLFNLQKLAIVRHHNRSDGMEIEIKLRPVLTAQLEHEKERFDSYHRIVTICQK